MSSIKVLDANRKEANAYLLPRIELPPKGVAKKDSGDHFLCPFWCVQEAGDSTEVNMALGNMQVQSALKCVAMPMGLASQ
eukprot:7266036-Pyramimonas_sp.AAC.1